MDGQKVKTKSNVTLWQVAKELNKNIPYLCLKDSDEYRPDGNCRACMVEVEGEKNLSASCIRFPSDGMKVNTTGERVKKNRKLMIKMKKPLK